MPCSRSPYRGRGRNGRCRSGTFLGGLLALLAAAAVLAPAASGADRVYWANVFNSTISYANVDGSGAGGDLNTAGATIDTPTGPALDPAAGRVFWPNGGFFGGPQGISFANLDGSGAGGDLNIAGATMNFPIGPAIDAAAGRIYWVNNGNGGAPQGISYANLDGSGGGDLSTAGATVDSPVGVTVDPAAGRLYWANSNANTISYANLDGSGGGDLSTAGAIVNVPDGLAIDRGGGRIYWANNGSGSAPQGISFANLDGSGGGGDLSTPGATMIAPIGVTIDAAAGRLYWANSGFSGGAMGISYAYLDGSGGGDLSTGAASVAGPVFPAQLKAPAGSGAPAVSGGPGPRSQLSCSQGGWAPNQPAARLFRAPTSFAYQWSRYGKPIDGANASSYRPHAVGNYRCIVSAQNAAGAGSQASATHVAFAFGVFVPNRKDGTAKLIIKLPATGKVAMSGKTVKRQTRRPRLASKAKHLYKAALRVSAKGKARRKLLRSGAAKLKLRVGFTPKEAATVARTKTVTLKLRRRPPARSRRGAGSSFPVGLG
jgi:hypothetical protein